MSNAVLPPRDSRRNRPPPPDSLVESPTPALQHGNSRSFEEFSSAAEQGPTECEPITQPRYDRRLALLRRAWHRLRPSWWPSFKKDIAVPVVAAIASGVATPLLLDVIRGSDAPQTGTEWTGAPEFHDLLEVGRGAGSTPNTSFRKRCRAITFAEPFERPPRVFVALEMIDAGYDGFDLTKMPTEASDWHPEKAFGAELGINDPKDLKGSRSIRVGGCAKDITKSGFQLCAYTWSNTRLHSANISWLALPVDKPE